MGMELDIDVERAGFEAHESSRWPANLPCRGLNMANVYHWYMGQYSDPETQRAFDSWLAARNFQPGKPHVADAGAPQCWACNRTYTLEQRADADGCCPHCGVEIELDESPASGSAAVSSQVAHDTAQRQELFRAIVKLGAYSKRLSAPGNCADIPQKLDELVHDLHAVRRSLPLSALPTHDLSAAGLLKLWKQAQDQATDTMPAPFQFARILLGVTPSEGSSADGAAAVFRKCSKYGHRCNCATDCVTAQPQEPAEAANLRAVFRCRDCYGPLGEQHSENCGVGRGDILMAHVGDSPIPVRDPA